MLSPFLPQALLLATDRAERLRSEADAARLARSTRPDGSGGRRPDASGGRRPGPLARLLAVASQSPWQTSAVVPQLRNYPYAAD